MSRSAVLQEAKRLVKAGLPIPAYMQLLKLSHSFNIMDARGAVGVTQRAASFGVMRTLAKQIAGSQLASHEICPQLSNATYLLQLGKVTVSPQLCLDCRCACISWYNITIYGSLGHWAHVIGSHAQWYSAHIVIVRSDASAGLWLKRREELEFPLGMPTELQPPAPAQPQGTLGSEPADLVVEVGCEELPPNDATSAVTQLRYRATSNK